jgi:hypothetical protein
MIAGFVGKKKRRDIMKLEKNIITVFTLGFLSVLLSVLLACTSSLDTYRGKTANQESRIALSGGSHNGAWQTDDLTVKYSYSRSPNNLQISGDVALKAKLTDASDVVQNFVLQVNFLNAAGQALGTKELVMAGYRETLTKWDFDHKFEPPASTSAMAFSYDGQMGGDRGGLAEKFWHDPFS